MKEYGSTNLVVKLVLPINQGQLPPLVFELAHSNNTDAEVIDVWHGAKTWMLFAKHASWLQELKEYDRMLNRI